MATAEGLHNHNPCFWLILKSRSTEKEMEGIILLLKMLWNQGDALLVKIFPIFPLSINNEAHYAKQDLILFKFKSWTLLLSAYNFYWLIFMHN